ncbi:1-aminocyclopropane-1-carboxylate deaminase [Arcobacter sp. CECT 8983]|uniref:1-aminocyclopropane-1-carboxylate deaminase/D-cysteine desulfhydrase n=1 Tax=Arcobacter sp. CECT 8983 TaxID=2044508 RepID=UPI00100B1AAD|nr:1-aminocyclopropane-1-carboxylate deaminase/D-cysteine desulfhydrase [Arcobacter sp. CECT 8983]RXJ89775.1 1-aminocyclopropane-1-carboxylate deaminase [Arcobacter sp. CECT 8983]
MNYINSPIEKIKFRNTDIYLKRDDLLDKHFSGNKARKFYYYLVNDLENINKVVSFGSAQANSLYSLSVLGKIKNLDIDFYVNHISSYLKENPYGNYKAALENGVNIIEDENFDFQNYELKQNEILIEEGARVQEAQFGIKILAQEIKTWAKENDIKNLKLFLPSGTGTTALFLQKHLEFEVFTVACVGGSEYLKKQFFHLESNEKFHPKIIQMPKKYHFGKLYKEFYDIYNELLKTTKIEFDLLYDPLGFLSMQNYLENKQNCDEFLYIHQGGILGNESMKPRYERKFNK